MTATGNDGLSIGAGDLIQTRKNNIDLGVANRQQWIVHQVTEDGTVFAREVGDPAKKARRQVALPPEYVAEHTHLSYAATDYGVQGATVDSSHTVLSEATSAAGIYVGMTRGRATNRLHVVAENLADARAQFVTAMERDPADRGLAHATEQAQHAIRGLIIDGPVQTVNQAIARLTAEAEQAEQQAARRTKTAGRFDTQRQGHRAEDERDANVLRIAEEEAAKLRAQVAAPLANAATADGRAYLNAVGQEDAARDKLATSGRFGRRKARTEHQTATERAKTVRERVRATWGAEPPRNTETLPAWAAHRAEALAEADPRVLDAAENVERARAAGEATRKRHEQEQTALMVSEYGTEQALRNRHGMGSINPHRQAREATTRAAAARREVEELRALPVEQAAARLTAQKTAAEEAQRRTAERARSVRDPHGHYSGRNGPARGF